MKNVVLSVLAVGDLYEYFTRLYIKKLDKIYNKEINLCITSDRDFCEKINSEKVCCFFNVLDESVVKPSGYTLPGHGKSTYFKYYLKSMALKYSATKFPNYSICHTDCDILPTKEFSDITFDLMNVPGLYCSNIVRCSGDYHRFQNDNGDIIINEKLKKIVNHFIPNFTDFPSLKCPIENRLYFNNIPQENLIKFCETWLEIGKFVDSSGMQRYGDCFEIKPACMLHDIEIIQTDLLPFDDGFKGSFSDMFNKRFLKVNCPEEYKNLNDEEFLDYALEKL
jgi:hypothetical protein